MKDVYVFRECVSLQNTRDTNKHERYCGNENFGRLFIVSGNRGIEITRRLKLRNQSIRDPLNSIS